MWGILALSLVSLSSYRLLSSLLLLIAIVLGGLNGVIKWQAIFLLITVSVCFLVKIKWPHKYLCRIIIEIGFVLSSAGLLIHIWPGFHNPLILNSVVAGPLSTPYIMYFNFDKALIPFLLLLGFPSLFNDGGRRNVPYSFWGMLLLSAPLLLMSGVFVGGLKPELHFPDWLPQFILSNLFFVSLAEEAFFRGYLQQRLSFIIHPLTALFISSCLFGLYHLSGGLLLVLFSTLAGFIYGLAWLWSGRVWVSTLFHFGLNLCHLLFFTYPLLKHH
ncbi:lysostaphin resistance A-like protein [Shigella flexneri]|uniref:CPBP family intramembrane glutamic endopeptidase n=1 Tax=Shigella flexneri TaxID=623 RepID=UPI0035B674A6